MSDSFSHFPIYRGEDLGVCVIGDTTRFRLWSPCAEGAIVYVYTSASCPDCILTLPMNRSIDGTWIATVAASLFGRYYSFSVCHNGEWLPETPDPWAKAVSCNGFRGAVIDMKTTDPEGWESDRGPVPISPVDAVIYEMHHRDMSAHASSGIMNKGKFLAMTEYGTVSPDGEPTGIDHLVRLGITHVQLLPSFDFSSVDEDSPSSRQYNWGYDPAFLNVPEGSYSTDPADPACRIREMKQMIMSFHRRGIGVILDIVYNHTADTLSSPFSLTAPGYYYRTNPDGTLGNASGCGNETASEREQMRLFMIQSAAFWVKEYHIDGFRFDLMGTHDIETMNILATEIRNINPSVLIYGEGWTALPSVLPENTRAVQKNISRLDRIGVFSDIFRDAIKGHFADRTDKGFVSGSLSPDTKEAVMAGLVGFVDHPQISGWMVRNRIEFSPSPEYIINYVSCHDNLTLTDKLAASMTGCPKSLRSRAARLAQTIVFCAQGIPFIFAGEELFRDKKGNPNSYNSPDAVNAIDWRLKSANKGQFEYYCHLIALRRRHPAFRLRSIGEVIEHIVFEDDPRPYIIHYSITGHAGGDTWKEIRIVFNGTLKAVKVMIPRCRWSVIAEDGILDSDGLRISRGGYVTVAGISALILARL